jgi:hypothetical protein
VSANPRRARLERIHRIAESLREPVDAPDLTSSILSRVHEQRPFLAGRTRRWILWARLGVGAAAVFMVLMVVIIQRTAPQATNWCGRPQPLSAVVDTVECEAAKLGTVQPFRLVFRRAPGGGQNTISFPATSRDRDDPSPDPAWTFTARTEAPSVYTVSYYAGAEGSPMIVRPVFLGSSHEFDPIEPGGSYSPAAWPTPAFPVRHADRNLLRDLAPLITGQPAGEGLVPR